MKHKTSLKIKVINHGIACRIGDIIYINKKLKDYPQLFYAILDHEKKHTSGFSLKDITLDLRNEEIAPFKKEYYKFIIQNPSSLTELLPVGRYDGKWVFNPLLSFLWLITGGIVCLVLVLLN